MQSEQRRLQLKTAQANLEQFLKSPNGRDVVDYLSSILGVFPLKARTESDTYFNLGMFEVIEHLKTLGENK